MKMYKKSIVACALLSVAGAGNCGISERSWFFMPNETVTYDFTKTREYFNMGIEAGCDSFNPTKSSFIITYSGTPEAEKRLYVETNDKSNVIHDKNLKTFYVKDATQIAVGFPSGGTYSITNVTPTAIKGTQCDAGYY
ncbi:hypothetical protein [Xanthomonas albilineans]|uniref:hypothetical protein n=1 Tax=Xanthomonas albilineans TaxID=29447 RepID=UPI0011AFDCB6|nr:hypothetical protein [Xanthomonas albilineans]